MDLALVQCPNCVKVLQYYDYMSHQEICRNYENFTNKEARDSFLEKPYQNKGFKGAEAPSAEALADADDENEDDDEDYFDYNNGFKGAEAPLAEAPLDEVLDIYNPMFNRGFTNHRYSNMDDNMNTDMRDNSLANLLTNIENLDIGLGRDNIEQYGCKIAILEIIECAICLNAYDIGSEFYTMKCMHSFCKICSELWFESRSFCPLCKTNLKL
jgi:hypothetical protein